VRKGDGWKNRRSPRYPPFISCWQVSA